MPDPITRQELQTLIDRNEVSVVEALSVAAFEQAHLPGALHLGNDDIEGRADAVLPDKDATVVTYCANTACANSGQAAHRLESLGYSDVREYVEGKEDWEQAGLPLEREGSAAA